MFRIGGCEGEDCLIDNEVSSNKHLIMFPVEVWERITYFLPIREILRIRQTSRIVWRACESHLRNEYVYIEGDGNGGVLATRIGRIYQHLQNTKERQWISCLMHPVCPFDFVMTLREFLFERKYISSKRCECGSRDRITKPA